MKESSLRIFKPACLTFCGPFLELSHTCYGINAYNKPTLIFRGTDGPFACAL